MFHTLRDRTFERHLLTLRENAAFISDILEIFRDTATDISKFVSSGAHRAAFNNGKYL
jgi:hypothetical protein